MFHPMLQRHEGIMCRVVHRWGRSIDLATEQIAERVRPGPEGAVIHTRHHEQAIEALRLFRRGIAIVALCGDHTQVMVDRLLRRDQWIGPAVIHEQLSTQRLEPAQVRAVRVQDRIEQIIDRSHVLVEIEGLPQPSRAEHPLEQRIERRLGLKADSGPAELRIAFAALH